MHCEQHKHCNINVLQKTWLKNKLTLFCHSRHAQQLRESLVSSTHTLESDVTHNITQTFVCRMTVVYHWSTFSPEWALCRLFFMFRLFSLHTMTVWVRLQLLFSVKTKRNMWCFTRAFRAACWSFWGIVSLWSTNM